MFERWYVRGLRALWKYCRQPKYKVLFTPCIHRSGPEEWSKLCRISREEQCWHKQIHESNKLWVSETLPQNTRLFLLQLWTDGSELLVEIWNRNLGHGRRRKSEIRSQEQSSYYRLRILLDRLVWLLSWVRWGRENPWNDYYEKSWQCRGKI